MRGVGDLGGLRSAMEDNAGQPEGPARNARAEQLVGEAERLGDPAALVEALAHHVRVGNHSSEKDRVFVPFTRLLGLWDEHPEHFGEAEAHSLHWFFKWMSAGMLDQVDVPLASIEKWLGEMERRYRLAGYSDRAVRASELWVAAHVGDTERAERAFVAWLGADRDDMADCHACELNGQGRWHAERGRDAEALAAWAPVVEGEFVCAHEPHNVLASSLLPLLRLGRAAEARANHLRGLRLVRPMESMRTAYADHVEFCALTGNEARGLELLAERPAYFDGAGHPRGRMEYLSTVALLMDRLAALGLGEQAVPGPAGRAWTARELAGHARENALSLAARFDARNGTPYVGERTRARMERAPLVERLPLGVRVTPSPPARGPEPTVPPVAVPPVAVPHDTVPPGTPLAEPGPAALLDRARRLSEALRPNAMEAWAAAARACEGVELDVRERAELADHRAMGQGPEGAALFEHAAELYAEAGDPGESLAARTRAAYVRALGGDVEGALASVAGPYEEVLALYAEDATGVRQAASVLMGRARVLMRRAQEAVERTGAVPAPEVLGAARDAVTEVLALVDGRGDGDVRLAARAAEARAMLADLAAHAGEPARAAALFERAAAQFVAAGLPWFAVEYEARLAMLAHQLEDVDGTERALRAALEHGGPYLEPPGRAQLHLQLAEVLGGLDEVDEAARQALEAAHWADEAGDAAFGAWARQMLGGFLLRQGDWAEAAEVLESALTDLSAEVHGDGPVVQTLWWLGDCLSELGEHRAAAERWLLAAETARHWPEQQDHATLAHLAGEALGAAGLPAEADRAYARAGALWRELGDPHGLVRSLRARAWLALDAPDAPDAPDGAEPATGSAAAVRWMEEAVEECASALDAAAGEDSRRLLTNELGDTHRQFGELLARIAETETAVGNGAGFEAALARLLEAVAVFAALGDLAVHARTEAELAAGRLALDLGRPGEARARASAVVAAYAALGPESGPESGLDADPGSTSGSEDTARERVREAGRLLRLAREREET
ncbi:tetratricopeptide repeat protein [Streptomyces sp. NPDC006458]|uniref:tetratricopeptide repeat protein n=1 Tax=Streptomyces sp. NPDC006458 TaxID=3154302 RepID=UPI0033A7FC74